MKHILSVTVMAFFCAAAMEDQGDTRFLHNDMSIERANTSAAYDLPSEFLASIAQYAFDSNGVVNPSIKPETFTLGYQLFLLSYVLCHKDRLLDAVPVYARLPDALKKGSIFDFNRVARNVAAKHQISVQQKLHTFLNVGPTTFAQLTLEQVKKHWNGCLAYMVSRLTNQPKKNLKKFENTREYCDGSDHPLALFEGLVSSHLAAFIRAQIDLHVTQLFGKEHTPGTCAYHAACCHAIRDVSALFGYADVPELSLVANFVHDTGLYFFAQRTYAKNYLRATKPSHAFSIKDLLIEDPYALKRLVPAQAYSDVWKVRMALIDLNHMGVRNVRGIDRAILFCANYTDKIAIFPFKIRRIKLLPKQLDMYIYAFAGVSLAHNKIQRLYVPRNERWESEYALQSYTNYMLHLDVGHNPLYQIAKGFPLLTRIEHVSSKPVSAPAKEHAHVHNAHVAVVQKTYLEEACVGWNNMHAAAIGEHIERTKKINRGFCKDTAEPTHVDDQVTGALASTVVTKVPPILYYRRLADAPVQNTGVVVPYGERSSRTSSF